MKLLRPTIPTVLSDVHDVTSLLRADDRLRGVRIDGADISNLKLKALTVEESLINKTNFSHTQVEKFEAQDCIFQDCDMTTTSFTNSSWHVVEMIGVRCSGIQLQTSQLKNVVFKGCKLELANFRFSTLENVVFEDCLINELDFYNATLKNISFRGSSIENATFLGARLKAVDLSTAHITSLKNVTGLKGATISYEQLVVLGPYFMQELGIVIKD